MSRVKFLKLSRRSFFIQTLTLSVAACTAAPKRKGSIMIGVVSYDQGQELIGEYENFNRYLASSLGVRVEIEPAYNESKALERLKNNSWSLVFAPPGIAALAIAVYRYVPIFPSQEQVNNRRAIIFVLKNNSVENIKDLQGKTVVLGQVGSATGYYFPLYNLFGLTLKEVIFGSSPKNILEIVAKNQADAGSLSLEEFNTYKSQFPQQDFRILFTDSHPIPVGVVLISSMIDSNFQQQIIKVMKNISPDLAQKANYIPNAPVPDYDYMISVVQRVKPLSEALNTKPVKLF